MMSLPTDARLSLASTLLERHPCPGVRAEHLASAIEAARIQRLGPGNALCTEGESPDALYILVEGHIRVQRRDSTGRMRPLATISAPSLVGHMALIDRSTRSASCVAEGKVSLVVIDLPTYERLIGEATPRGAALRRLLLSSLATQLTQGNQRIRDLMHTPHEDAADADEADVLRIAGVLEGWKVDDRGLDEVSFVEDEDR